MQLELDGDGPLHRQIERSIRASILDGRLESGQRLPSSRDLAEILGVSRPVVQLAYQQLCVEGYTRARIGSGTYVEDVMPERHLRAPAPSPATVEASSALANSRLTKLSEIGARLAALDLTAPPRLDRGDGAARVDFRYGSPPSDPTTIAIWKRLLRAQASRLEPSRLNLGDPSGYLPLRRQLARHLRMHRAVRCKPEQIVVTSGTQQALDLTTRLVIDPGDVVALEDPHYVGARDAFTAAGARLLPLPVDDQGAEPAAIVDSRRPVAMVYLTPAHQFPTGATMSAARRAEILDAVAESPTLIIEDDYDGEFRHDAAPLPSMQGQAEGDRVLYTGSFSKVLFPALRMGFAVVPPYLVEPFRCAKWAADCQSPILEQMTLTAFLEEGYFDRHLRRARKQMQLRRGALLQAFERHIGSRARLLGHEAGVHALVRFPDLGHADLERLTALTLARGVRVRSSKPYHLNGPRSAELILGYGALTETAIRYGMARLGEALDELSC